MESCAWLTFRISDAHTVSMRQNTHKTCRLEYTLCSDLHKREIGIQCLRQMSTPSACIHRHPQHALSNSSSSSDGKIYSVRLTTFSMRVTESLKIVELVAEN